MFIAVILAMLPCDVTLPPKPPLIRESDYAHVLRYAKMGEKGQFAWSLTGLRSLILADGVTIAIDPLKVPSYLQADTELSLNEAVRSWNRWLGTNLLSVSHEPKTATLKLGFTGSLSPGFKEICLGESKFERIVRVTPFAPNYKLVGRIEIVRTFNGKVLTQPELTSVITHELGHVLGLDDALTTTGVMGLFEHGKERLQPSQEEIESVALYRGIISAVIERISSIEKS